MGAPPPTYRIVPAPVRSRDGKAVFRNGKVAVHRLEARYVEDTRDEKNAKLGTVSVAIRRDEPVEGGTVKLLADVNGGIGAVPGLGEYIGGGAYGLVFVAPYRGKTRELLKTVARRSRHWIFATVPPANAPVATKIVRVRGKSSGAYVEFLGDGLTEASFHAFLSSAGPVRLPACRPLQARESVPRFYHSGVVIDSLTREPMFVTTMSVVPGMSLEKLFEGGRALRADEYVRIEQAVAVPWLYGVAHSDLHLQNVMYHPATRRATLIDFGMCTLMPRDLRNAARSAVCDGIAGGVPSLGEVWMSPGESRYGIDLARFVNRVQHKRRHTWYNPDGRLLLILHGLVSESERSKIPAWRQKVWGHTPTARASGR